MSDSMNLLTAQITFLSSPLLLVHIPVQHFQFFIQPIFRIVFGETQNDDVAWTDQHEFLNLSITPVGCSLICSKHLVEKYFAPLAKRFNTLIDGGNHSKSELVEITSTEYIAIEVDGQGLEAGERVLELTAPLAMAGISIFFITTYFSDYILVPLKAKQTVITTLQQRGFVFSPEAEAYVSQLSPTLNYHNHSLVQERPSTGSSTSSDGRPTSSSAPTTPPAKDVPELQIRTFTKLRKHGIQPIVDSSLRLVSCAGSREGEAGAKQQLREDLMQLLLASGPIALRRDLVKSNGGVQGLAVQSLEHRYNDDEEDALRFLSITLSVEPISILTEERLLPRLGSSLLVSKSEEDILTPIIFDLRSLGWQATGIIGGVAGRLSQRLATFELEDFGGDDGDTDISFLSTAKAGLVIIQANHLRKALRALEAGMEEVKQRS